MRVITGIAKGTRLETLEGKSIRPTTDKVKEGIFSSIQFDIENSNVLDLFSGSGQIGIEALSRGAAKCTFVDCSDDSLKITKRNLIKAKLIEKSVVIKSDSVTFISNTKEKYDIAFLDPPYKDNILITAAESCALKMSEYGVMICEHPTDVVMPEKFGKFPLYRQYKYGKITVSVYRVFE